MNIKFADVNTSTLNDDGTVTKVWNDFQFPQELNIFGAGTLGDTISFFSEVTFGENPDGTIAVELEHARLDFDSPFGPEDAFHFRLGKMMPNLDDGFQEMQISTDAAIDAVFAYNPIGLAGGTGLVGDQSGPVPISLPDRVRGIEAYGIVVHRAMWTAGIANGIGPGPNGTFDGNNAKDLYARFDYKFGGMGLDGNMEGRQPPAENWRDNSLRVAAFVYRGDGSNINFPVTLPAGAAVTSPAVPPASDQTSPSPATPAQTTPGGAQVNIQDTHFLRTGFFVNWFFQDLNVFGAYVRGTDTLDQLTPDTAVLLGVVNPTYYSWFTQADYLIYPWLQATARYETVRPGDQTIPSLRLGTFNGSALIRANVKAMIEYQRDLREGRNYSLNGLVRFAF